MNKTIIININGMVFHIEEDAYEILKNYMTDVKRHFLNSADSLEITTDIENRIAEMFSEILIRESKQVIVELDVSWVVEQMGTVADFEADDADNNTVANPFINNSTENRRLFRDPDDHLVAGVASGIANYFDFNPVWIRLAFALSITFAGGGFILYLILWIVVPKAVTRADRMAMKGEKQNLQGFKKNFEEELSTVKQNLSDFGHEARPFVYKARDFVGDFFGHLGVFFAGAGKILVKLIGIFILLACFGFTIFLVVSLIAGVGFGQTLHEHIFPFRIIENQFANKIYISAFLLASIPLIIIILLVLKGIFNTGRISRATGTVFLSVWICALVVLIYYASIITAGFRDSASFTKTINLKPASNNTYYLKLNDIKYFSHEDSLRLDIKDHFRNMVVIDDDNNSFNDEPRSVTINIEKSDIKTPVLEERFRANGGNYDDALFNARNTSYVFAQQDSVLKFDYTLRRRPNISYHAEEIILTLKVPLNSTVVIDQRLDNFLPDGGIVYQCKETDKHDKATSAVFTMTDNGLQCKIDTLVIKRDSIKTDSIKTADSTQTAQR